VTAARPGLSGAGPQRRLGAADALAALLVLALVALGVWQVRRLGWKTRLIAATAARLAAPPAPAPGPDAWARLTREGDAYRRVTVRGAFLPDRDTFVQAVTELGGGYWVLTPLRTDRGFTVLVNRGFVPAAQRDLARRPDAQEGRVTGLLRWSEPHGGFLRANRPAADRWYARDVPAIAARRGLGVVAPYFIDADAGRDPADWPRGGLTVVSFPNSHLVYAITWFGMALLTLVGTGLLLREERRRR
jgi:surfeit locus 1 family protein